MDFTDYTFHGEPYETGSTQILLSHDRSSPAENLCQAQIPSIASPSDLLVQGENQGRSFFEDDPSCTTVSPQVEIDGDMGQALLPSGNNTPFTSVPSKRVAKQDPEKRTHRRFGGKATVQDITDGDGDRCLGFDDTDTKKQQEGKAFACPYYRKDPIRYFDCITRKLNRIQDLKQHLQRRHTDPYSCSICLKGFRSSESFENHARSSRCVRENSGTKIDSVSPRAQKLLKDRIDRKLSSKDQWYKIWKILFEDPDTTQNPHLNSMVEEVFGIIRDFCNKEGHQVVSSFVQSRGLPVGNIDLLQPLLTELLGVIQSRIEQKSRESASREALVARTENDLSDTEVGAKSEPMFDSAALFATGRNNDYESSIVKSESSTPVFNFSGPSSNASEPDYIPHSSSVSLFSFMGPSIPAFPGNFYVASPDPMLAGLSPRDGGYYGIGFDIDGYGTHLSPRSDDGVMNYLDYERDT